MSESGLSAFWFSKKHRQNMNQMGRPLAYAKLEDGEVVEYTDALDADSGDKPEWPDAEFLGRGAHSHVVLHK